MEASTAINILLVLYSNDTKMPRLVHAEYNVGVI